MADAVFKRHCVELRKQGFGLNAIAQKLKRSRTSVYFHIRNFPPTQEQKREWIAQSTARITSFNQSNLRKGVSALGRTPRFFAEWSEETVLLVAHLLFDGEIKKFGCNYNNRNVTLVKRVERLMRALYPFKPKYYLNPVTVFSNSKMTPKS